MNVFICWSGSRSERIATGLYEWLGDVIQALKPFMSSESIRKGDRWRSEIAENLAQTNYGILCLTAESLASPWILFEAGALSKHLKDSHVTALLIGVDATQVVEPLSQFQATPANKEHIFRLAKELNDLLPPEQRLTPPERLQRTLEGSWPRLEKVISEVLAEKPTDVAKPQKRPTDEMVEEILTLVRELKRSNPSDVFWSELLRNNSNYLGDSFRADKAVMLKELMKLSSNNAPTIQEALERPRSGPITIGEAQSLLDNLGIKLKKPEG